MNTKDIRWIQRFNNFSKAFGQLTRFIEKGELNELEQQGLIQSFEYTHEIAWNCLKDFLEYRGSKGLYGSKDATREAFRLGLIEDGEGWMSMIESRNQSTHTYNEKTAEEIITSIRGSYYSLFNKLRIKLLDLTGTEQE